MRKGNGIIMLQITQQTCDEKVEPTGISSSAPSFSWKLSGDLPNTLQKRYCLCVFDGEVQAWNSGMVESGCSVHIPYDGAGLRPHREYRWKVTATDNHGETAVAESCFFSGKLSEPWTGKWIGTARLNDKKNALPPELFQRMVTCEQKLVRGMLYISAMGIYEVTINGAEIGSCFFCPGYTHYQTYLQFQAYDVTPFVRQEKNDLRVTVANGWYLGTIGNKNNNYGDHRGLIAELHLWYGDGSHAVVGTDESWRHTIDTPLRYADFYNGETIDETMADESKWRWESAKTLTGRFPNLVPHEGAFVTEDCRLKSTSSHPVSGGIVYDFAQNHAGVIHLVVDAPKGTEITLRHGEILNEDGSLFTENLRNAGQKLTFICGRDGVQEFLPRFTFMGFRYAELKVDRAIQIKEMESIVLTSNAKATGRFSCSDPLLTRFQQNIQWGQCSNFIDIPTDCPQRDERMGWTGDIAVFAPSAAFNRDISSFMRKWLHVLRLDQWENGSIPVTVPEIKTYSPTPLHIPIAIWGDAATMVPWAVYQAYGDKELLEIQYESMKLYTEAERRAAAAHGHGKSKYLWNHNPFQYGDWCAAGESFTQWKRKGNHLATAYFANSVEIMRKAAKALGKTEDEREYAALHEKICDAFSKLCFKSDGRLKGDFQSNYVCALYFGLIPEEKKPAAAGRLAELVRQKDYCVMTGFAGTPYIAFALADNGYLEDAYRLLQNTKCPGWLFIVKAGGTTVWERWDALDENGHFREMGKQTITDMVSFNHYAYGAVGDFFYRRILGLEPLEAGYKRFSIKPLVGGTLTHAEGALETGYGTIEVGWRMEEDGFHLQIAVPVNTRCDVTLPNGESYVTGSGKHDFFTKK